MRLDLALTMALMGGVVVLACAARILVLGSRIATTPEDRAIKRRAMNRTAGIMLVAVLGLVIVEVLGG